MPLYPGSAHQSIYRALLPETCTAEYIYIYFGVYIYIRDKKNVSRLIASVIITISMASVFRLCFASILCLCNSTVLFDPYVYHCKHDITLMPTSLWPLLKTRPPFLKLFEQQQSTPARKTTSREINSKQKLQQHENNSRRPLASKSYLASPARGKLTLVPVFFPLQAAVSVFPLSTLWSETNGSDGQETRVPSNVSLTRMDESRALLAQSMMGRQNICGWKCPRSRVQLLIL